jgi:hypothetical protein
MRLIKQTIIAGALALALVPYASAAVLVVNGNGILTGATGVDVGGTLYDVSFGDEILGLDSITGFTDVFNAFKASEALGDQVFINQFDATPSLTLGCPTSLVCIVDTPFGFGATGFLRSASFTNIDESFAVSIDVSEEARSLGLDYSLDSSRTLARWSLSGPVAAIPEPETYAMMLAGLGLLGAVSRRRKQKAAI